MLREATTAGHANAGAVRGSSGGHGRDRQRSDADAGQRPERWLVPALSLEAIRLVAALGGTLGPELTAATRPDKAAGDLLERINRNTLARRPKECLDSAGPLFPGARARWGGRCLGRAARQARPLGQATRPLGPATRPSRQVCRARQLAPQRAHAAGRHVPRARVHPAPTRRRPAGGALHPAERRDGSRRGGADRRRPRPSTPVQLPRSVPASSLAASAVSVLGGLGPPGCSPERAAGAPRPPRPSARSPPPT